MNWALSKHSKCNIIAERRGYPEIFQVATGILEKVSYSEWAAPIVAVPKKDGKFRVCGDYKVTINPVLEVDCRGQRNSSLHGIPGVAVYIDDILITAKSDPTILREVLSRSKQYELWLKLPKCCFMRQSLEYLGYLVDKDGLHALPDKVEAVVDAPEPKDTTELRAYLGLLNYYGKFLPNLAGKFHPLNNLLRKEQPWVWSRACTEMFNWSEASLASSEVLAHYDPSLPIRLAADASAYGIGAVLSHVMQDGSEHGPGLYTEISLRGGKIGDGKKKGAWQGCTKRNKIKGATPRPLLLPLEPSQSD